MKVYGSFKEKGVFFMKVFKELLPYIMSSLPFIFTVFLLLVSKIFGHSKAKKLIDVYNLIYDKMREIEKTSPFFTGHDKKTWVISEIQKMFPHFPVEEISKIIENLIIFSKEVNKTKKGD